MSLAPRDALRLARHAADADRQGRLHAAQAAVFHHRGWARLLAPRRDGGAEMPLPDAVRLLEAIAHADGSCGWVATLCAGAGWFAGFLPPALAAGVMATRRVCLSGSGAPSGFADREGDGFRIRGQWRWATGAPMATHFTMNAVLREHGEPLTDATGQPRIRAFLVPARDVQVVRDWNTIGLRATETHSFRIDGAWVPASQAFTIDAAAATADGPLYRFPFLTFAYVTLAATMGGMADHFLQLALPLACARSRALQAGMHGQAGPLQAQAAVSAARGRFHDALDAAWAAHVQGLAIDEAVLRDAALAWVATGREAVDAIYPWCGLHAADAGSAINRVWRDFHTGTQHALLLPAG